MLFSNLLFTFNLQFLFMLLPFYTSQYNSHWCSISKGIPGTVWWEERIRIIRRRKTKWRKGEKEKNKLQSIRIINILRIHYFLIQSAQFNLSKAFQINSFLKRSKLIPKSQSKQLTLLWKSSFLLVNLSSIEMMKMLINLFCLLYLNLYQLVLPISRFNHFLLSCKSWKWMRKKSRVKPGKLMKTLSLQFKPRQGVERIMNLFSFHFQSKWLQIFTLSSCFFFFFFHLLIPVSNNFHDWFSISSFSFQSSLIIFSI